MVHTLHLHYTTWETLKMIKIFNTSVHFLLIREDPNLIAKLQSKPKLNELTVK